MGEGRARWLSFSHHPHSKTKCLPLSISDTSKSTNPAGPGCPTMTSKEYLSLQKPGRALRLEFSMLANSPMWSAAMLQSLSNSACPILKRTVHLNRLFLTIRSNRFSLRGTCCDRKTGAANNIEFDTKMISFFKYVESLNN